MSTYRLITIFGAIILSVSIISCTKNADIVKDKDDQITMVKGKITFFSDRGWGALFLLKDGRIERLALKGGSGRFSSDGNKIYFRIGSQLFVYNLLDNTKKELIEVNKYNPSEFDLSPDNKQIVFESRGQKFDYDIPYNIYVVNIDGTGYKQLTFFTGGPKGWNAKGAERPRWSPDGKSIVFNGPDIINKSGTSWAIYTIKPDGTDLKKIIGENSFPFTGSPNWSPDSKKIVFYGYRTDKEPGYMYIAASSPNGSNPQWKQASYEHIFIANADGANVNRITTGAYDDYDPVFSPDGRQICFASRRHYVKDKIPNALGSELYVINIDGTNEVRITPSQLLGEYNISPHLGSYATDSSPDWHE